jgi:hypothetical protein
MASQEPPVQFDENPNYEEIPEKQSIFDFNEFDSIEEDSEEDEQAIATIIQDQKTIDEASQSADDATKDEEKEQEEESTPEVITRKSQLNTAVFEQAELEEEIVEVLAETKAKRIKTPSKRFAEFEQQKEEEARLKEEARLREEAKQEAQLRLQEKKEKEMIDITNVTDSQLKNESGVSETDTSIAHRFITVGRLETYKPTSQAGVIFGEKFMEDIDGNTLCALCGFKLKDRISYWHNVFHNKPDPENTLTWSFDHRPPINFSAVMFRIVVAEGKEKYTPDELKNLRVTGDIVCFHCNYEKSQRLFITCPKEKDTDKSNFSGFSPNDEVIEKYVNDLFNSKHRSGYSQIVGERTLQNCLKAARKSKNEWIEQRIGHIKGLAQEVCNMIRDKVDRANVVKRYKLTKIIVRQGYKQALQDKNYPKDLRSGQQNRFIKEYIAKLFAAAELKILPKPWKKSPAPATVATTATTVSTTPPVAPSYMRSTASSSAKEKEVKGPKKDKPIDESKRGQYSKTKPFSANAKRAGSRRKHKKNKRKTYRRIRLF